MSEITKLYENAEVKKQIPKVCSSNEENFPTFLKCYKQKQMNT